VGGGLFRLKPRKKRSVVGGAKLSRNARGVSCGCKNAVRQLSGEDVGARRQGRMPGRSQLGQIAKGETVFTKRCERVIRK